MRFEIGEFRTNSRLVLKKEIDRRISNLTSGEDFRVVKVREESFEDFVFLRNVLRMFGYRVEILDIELRKSSAFDYDGINAFFINKYYPWGKYFNFRKVIYPDTFEKCLNKVLRRSINYQIKEFRRLNKVPDFCEECERDLNKFMNTVDHIFRFRDIVKLFHKMMEEEGHDIPEYLEISRYSRMWQFQEKDLEYKVRFQIFHSKFEDNLRYLCVDCNLGRG